MSGRKGERWAKKGIHVSKDTLTYTGDTVKKGSTVMIDQAEDVEIKIGLRLRRGQLVDVLEIKRPGSPTALTLTELDPRAHPEPYADLNTVLPAASDERWILYTAPFSSSFGRRLVTTLQLRPDPAAPDGGFRIHDNGFQVVTIIGTARAVSLATGHYFFGVSLINGRANTLEPYTVDIDPATKRTTRSDTKTKVNTRGKGTPRGKVRPRRGA